MMQWNGISNRFHTIGPSATFQECYSMSKIEFWIYYLVSVLYWSDMLQSACWRRIEAAPWYPWLSVITCLVLFFIYFVICLTLMFYCLIFIHLYCVCFLCYCILNDQLLCLCHLYYFLVEVFLFYSYM
jgi:hypothetical protein